MKFGESSFDLLYLLFAIISGMLMLPKTICYILLIVVFLRSVFGETKRTAAREKADP